MEQIYDEIQHTFFKVSIFQMSAATKDTTWAHTKLQTTELAI